jgi:hypothetical protein
MSFSHGNPFWISKNRAYSMVIFDEPGSHLLKIYHLMTINHWDKFSDDRGEVCRTL